MCSFELSLHYSGLINNVRTFYKYYISHHEKYWYLSMANDQELPDDQLPPGQAPVWINAPEGVTRVEMLERVEEIIGPEYTDAMVLSYSRNESVAFWCEDRGWQYHSALNITGCEAKCVVLLNCGLSPEWITRGVNWLIIVSW